MWGVVQPYIAMSCNRTEFWHFIIKHFWKISVLSHWFAGPASCSNVSRFWHRSKKHVNLQMAHLSRLIWSFKTEDTTNHPRRRFNNCLDKVNAFSKLVLRNFRVVKYFREFSGYQLWKCFSRERFPRNIQFLLINLEHFVFRNVWLLNRGVFPIRRRRDLQITFHCFK